MIAYLSGELLEKGPDYVVLLAGDVGYRVQTTAPHGPLWVHAITGETGTRLYGFQTQPERDRFVELLGVDGVGPKTAMAIGMTPLTSAALCAVRGVGKKTAEKIVEALCA
ncbi:MAG TPA: OB-fold domain-containing protein [Gammaproteobacteria bacterium]|nr:OB-fold domain-containing protein [Gammaproteobacteria bacterium]